MVCSRKKKKKAECGPGSASSIWALIRGVIELEDQWRPVVWVPRGSNFITSDVNMWLPPPSSTEGPSRINTPTKIPAEISQFVWCNILSSHTWDFSLGLERFSAVFGQHLWSVNKSVRSGAVRWLAARRTSILSPFCVMFMFSEYE